MNGGLADRHGRPLRSLRVSVTDRCNLRCRYCMPEAEYSWLPRQDLLDFEEIRTVTAAFARNGVSRVRLTGGEPLLRRDLDQLVARLVTVPGIEDVALTTNGIKLAELAPALRRAGLHRLTVSLDTLRPDRFRDLTRNDGLEAVLSGIEAAHAAGFEGTKIDTVVMRGFNDDELLPLLEFGRDRGVEVRFIEYMDVGGATEWAPEKVLGRAEILERVTEELGELTVLPGRGSAPAERFRAPDGTTFGVIASTTSPFCESCDRSRLTADGHWYLCLYAELGHDLRSVLRGDRVGAIDELIARVWGGRTDRGAEERTSVRDRGILHPNAKLSGDPHLEMHTRGG